MHLSAYTHTSLILRFIPSISPWDCHDLADESVGVSESTGCPSQADVRTQICYPFSLYSLFPYMVPHAIGVAFINI